MPDLVLHPRTVAKISDIVEQPAQAIVLIGPTGLGKATLVQQLAANILQVPSIIEHPAVHVVAGSDTSISIDAVRDLQHFLSLKTTNNKLGTRIGLIPDAGKLTHEAQNALLKTLEEPPEGTVLLLTAAHLGELLPTIQSRVRSLSIDVPALDDLKQHFMRQGHDAAATNRALLMSGGLPGLATDLLAGNDDHPLALAATTAGNILRLDTFGRLAIVDTLSKDRMQALRVLYMLQQMALVSLCDQTKAALTLARWRTVLTEAREAERALTAQSNPKLCLTGLMLSL
jgi:DNA polymerase-3 subunit delta'